MPEHGWSYLAGEISGSDGQIEEGRGIPVTPGCEGAFDTAAADEGRAVMLDRALRVT